MRVTSWTARASRYAMIPAVASQGSGSRSAALLFPLVLLVGYAIVFASVALGVGVVAFDDHPGQLYRLWHVVDNGPAPWAWNEGWWTGYPELQFYPPAFAYAGALLHVASLGAISVPAAYQALVWLAYLAPGVTAWVLLARLLANGWLALPGAFVALTLSLWPTLMSGVEGGVHVGMAPARLAWALLPLLAVTLARWCDGVAALPARRAVVIVAAIALMHPAHLPAAVLLVALAALSQPGRARRLITALAALAAAAVVTAFWTVPLLARLDDTRALAWGALTPASVGDTLVAHPLVVVLAALAIVAMVLARTATERLLTRWPAAMGAVVALDAGVVEPLGVRWLPADRVLDAFWLALVLAAGLAAGRLLERLASRPALPAAVTAPAAVAAAIALSLAGHNTLALWPRPSAWPSYASLERGLRLPALWTALRGAPAGRVLFVRSAVPIVYGTEWWRPHTHVTALAPRLAGRAIVNGTFTHPSPIAALVYRGDAGRGPITGLVERLDGRSLFGRPLPDLDAATFNAHARRLGVSVVVALDEDLPRLPALADNPSFATRRSEPPFVIWLGAAAPLPQPLGSGRWRMTVEAAADGWTSAGVAYYPLWRATAASHSLPTRRGTFGDLEVRLPVGTTAIELGYRPGAAEWTGLALTASGALAWIALGVAPALLHRRRAGVGTLLVLLAGAAVTATLLLGSDRVREHHGAVLVDEAHLEVRRVDGHLAEIVEPALREDRARPQPLVQRARPARHRRQRPGDELVERPLAVGAVADQLGVVHIGGDEDQVADAPGAEVTEDGVALRHEARAVLGCHTEHVGVRPRVAPLGPPGRHRQRPAADDDLPRGGRRRHRVEQPLQLGGAQHRLGGAVRQAVVAAILPRVEDEHLEEPTPAHAAVQPRGIVPGGDRPVIDERLAPDRHQGLRGAGKVVLHLVVVPDRVHRRAAQELLERDVLAVVPMTSAVLGQRRGAEGGAGRRVELARYVGVRRVAHEEEELGPMACHDTEDAVVTTGRPAEATAAEIPTPQERHPGGLAGWRRRRELALHLFAVLRHAVAMPGPRGQSVERHADDEIVRLGGRRRQHSRGGARRANLDAHGAGTRRAGPENGRRRTDLRHRDQESGGRWGGRGEQQGQEREESGASKAQRSARPRWPRISRSNSSSVWPKASRKLV